MIIIINYYCNDKNNKRLILHFKFRMQAIILIQFVVIA